MIDQLQDQTTDDDLEMLRQVHDEARSRLPAFDPPTARVEVLGAVQRAASAHGVAIPDARPSAWRCAGQIGARTPCATLVPERGACCAECSEATGQQLRLTAMREARAALPAEALTFRQVRAIPSVDPAIVDACERWRRDLGSLTILGRSGLGKTASAKALVRRIVERAEAAPMPRADLVFAKNVRFVEAAELAQARRRHKLGDRESPLERVVRTASLVVLDDLGKDDPRDQQVVVEAICGRPPGVGPMIVTSELNREQIAKRYGVAIFRRLIERAIVVEALG